MIYIQATLGGEKFILEPSSQEDILLDVSTIENGEIGEVLSDLSRDFSFPATEENNRFFKHAFNVGYQDVPGTRDVIQVTVESDVETLFYGTMTLNTWDSVNDVYICSIQSGLIGLEEALQDKLIKDATDWPTGLTYSMDNWKSANEVSESGYAALDYYLPFIDLGFDEDSRPRIPNSDVIKANSANRATETIVVNSGNPTDSFGNDVTRVGATDAYYVDQSNEVVHGATYVSGTQYHGEIGYGQSVQGYITSYTTPLRIEQLVPAVKLGTVVDVIMKQAGFTWEASDGQSGNLFDTMLQDVFVMPKLREGLGIEGVTQSTDHQFQGVANNAANVDLNPGVQRVVAFDDDREVWKFSPSQSEIDPGGNWSGSDYTVPRAGTYEWNFKGNLNNVSDNFDTSREYISLKACILVNDVIVESVNLIKIERDYTLDTNDWDFSASINAYSGDKISAAVYMYSVKSGHFGNTHDMTGTIGDAEFRTSAIPLLWEGTTMNLGAQFMEETSIDILKGILQKFNFVAYADKNRQNHIIIQQYYDAILGSPRVDWSDKVDRDTYEHSPLLIDQEREITFTDKEGKDRFTADIDPVVGSVKVASTDEGITSGDKTIGDYFTSLRTGNITRVGDFFRNSNSNGYHGIPHLYEVDGVDQKAVEGGVYLGYSKCVNFDGTFFYADSTDARVAYTNVVRTFSEYNEDSDKTLAWFDDGTVKGAYSTYWQEYYNHLYVLNNIKLKCDVVLTPSEYKSIGWNTRIHIDGNDYLINKISGWNLSRPDVVSVELTTYRNNFVNVFEPPSIQYVEPDVAFKRTYNLGIEVIGYNGAVSSGVTFDNPVVQQDKYNITVVGQHTLAEGGDTEAATTEDFTVTVRALEGYEISASNFNTITAPTGVSGVNVVDGSSGEVIITGTITIQNTNTSAVLRIEGEVDPELEGNTSFDINWSQTAALSGGNVTINDLGDARGAIDGTGTLLATFSPPDGQTLSQTAFHTETSPLPTGVVSITYTKFGTSVLATAVVRFQQTDTTVNIQVDGNAPTNIPSGVNTSEVTLDLTETIPNVSTINDLSFRGVTGTRSNILIPLYAADGYRLDSDAFSATMTLTDGSPVGAELAVMYDAIGEGETTAIPIGVIFPQNDTTIDVALNGSAINTSQATADITINFVGAAANSGLTETTETLTVNRGANAFKYTNTLNPDQGYQLEGTTTAVETSDTGNVVSDLQINANQFAGNISMTITPPAVGTTNNPTATITIGNTVVKEPYTHTLNLSENLPLGKLSTTSYTERFGIGDTSTLFTSITVRAVDSLRPYPANTQFTVSGGSPSNYQYSGGDVTFDLSVTLPTFNASNPIGDVVSDIVITSTAPTIVPATTGAFGVKRIDIGRVSERVGTSIVTNGSWDVIQHPTADTITLSFEVDDDEKLTTMGDVSGTTGTTSTDTTGTWQLTNGLDGADREVLDTLVVTQSTTSAEGVTFMETHPVAVGGTTSSGGVTLFSYVDQYGDTEQRAITEGQIALICAVNGDIPVDPNNSSIKYGVTILQGTASIGPGTNTCATDSAGSVNGYNIVTQSSGTPASGTPNTTITLIPTV